jgi:hypothetical protein
VPQFPIFPDESFDPINPLLSTIINIESKTTCYNPHYPDIAQTAILKKIALLCDFLVYINIVTDLRKIYPQG